MKNLVQRLSFTVIFLYAWIGINAYDFMVDGIAYNMNSDGTSCSVTNLGSSQYYKGDINIPTTVTNKGVTYKITGIGKSAFSGCGGLTSIVIPNSIISIGEYAFSSCYNLSEVIIPNSTTSIEKGVFYGCSSLSQVSLPQNLNRIAESLFCDCSSLREINIPIGVNYLGGYAFEGCKSLKEIHLPDGISEIKERAFGGCSSLSRINIPENVTSIGQYAFRGCGNLQSIELKCHDIKVSSGAFSGVPIEIYTDYIYIQCNEGATEISIKDGIKKIHDSAFSNSRTDLVSVTIPNSVISIGSYAFSYCAKLSSISIPSSVTSIGSSAFSYCAKLSSITIPASVTYIGDAAFSNCIFESGSFVNNSLLTSNNNWGATIKEKIEYTKITSDGFCYIGDEIKAYVGEGGDVVIPSDVTKFPDVFYGNKSMTSIVIPKGITSIPQYAFSGCSSLTSVVIPEGVTSIPQYAFSSCSSLTSIVIPEGVISIQQYAFRNCPSLRKITIPSSVKNIGRYFLEDCKDVTIDISDIAAWCNISYDNSSSDLFPVSQLLYNGNKIKDLVIPEGVTKIISSYIFKGCKDVSSITIPSTMKEMYNAFDGMNIEKSKFVNNSQLTHISNWGAKLYDKITTDGFCINGSALEKYIGNGTDITIPNYITSISSQAFYNNVNIKTLNIPSNVTSIGSGVFKYCSNLESVTIGSGIKYINSEAFMGCRSLQNIELPQTITTIGSSAFSYCSALTTIKLPYSLLRLYEKAFAGCSTLYSITIPENVTTIEQKVFSDCYFQQNKFINKSSVNAVTNDYWGAIVYEKRDEDGFMTNGNTLIKYVGKDSEVTIPSHVTIIGKNAFYQNSTITDVIIPDGVETIEEYAFYNCTSLKSVKIPNSVTSIAKAAFEKSQISKYEMPIQITTLENSSLWSNINSFLVPQSVTYICRFNTSTCSDVVIEDGTNTLTCQDRNASDGYWPSVFSSVKTLYVGKNLRTYGSGTAGELLNSGLETMIIGKEAKEVLNDYYSMRRADNLKKVICLSKVPFDCPNFNNPQAKFAVFVPKGSKELYLANENWSKYGISEVQNVSISHSKEIEAYTPDFDIDLTNVEGLEAFVVLKYDNKKVELKRVNKIQAGQGVILKGSVGEYVAPCENITDVLDAEAPLVGTISGTYLTNYGKEQTLYYLSVEDDRYSFVPADPVYSMTLGRNNAYLKIPVYSNEITLSFIADKLIVTDGVAYKNTEDKNAEKIKYPRTFNNTSWQSLYIPFSMTYEDWKDDFEVAYINGIRQMDTDDDGAIDETIMDVVKIKSGSLIPNTPYLIKAKTTGNKTITVNNATLYKAESNSVDCSTTIAKYTFTGTYSTIPAATLLANNYYAMGDGSLIMTDGTSDLKPFRWYLNVESRSPMYNVSSGAKAITINVVGEEEATGISQMSSDREHSSAIYDLNGRRMSQKTLKSGLYIKNGKKIIIK